MHHRQDGLLKVSVKSFADCFRSNAQYRVSSLVLVFLFTLAGAGLAAMDPETQPAALVGYGARILGLLMIPQEFLLYDEILGLEKPRSSLLRMYLDSRILKYVWRYPVAVAAYALPGLLIAAATGWFLGWSKDEPLRLALVILLTAAAVVGVFSLALRLMFFPIFIALRQPKALATSFRAMRGKVWRTVRIIGLPFAALVAVFGLMSVGVGKFAGVENAFTGALLAFAVACLMVLLVGVETAMLAHAYKRILAPKVDEGGLCASATFAEAPEAMTADDASEAGDLAG